MNVVEGKPLDLKLHLKRLETSFCDLLKSRLINEPSTLEFEDLFPNHNAQELLKEAIECYLEEFGSTYKGGTQGDFGERITLLFTLRVSHIPLISKELKLRDILEGQKTTLFSSSMSIPESSTQCAIPIETTTQNWRVRKSTSSPYFQGLSMDHVCLLFSIDLFIQVFIRLGMNLNGENRDRRPIEDIMKKFDWDESLLMKNEFLYEGLTSNVLFLFPTSPHSHSPFEIRSAPFNKVLSGTVVQKMRRGCERKGIVFKEEFVSLKDLSQVQVCLLTSILFFVSD
jgi:hypothetical protein